MSAALRAFERESPLVKLSGTPESFSIAIFYSSAIMRSIVIVCFVEDFS